MYILPAFFLSSFHMYVTEVLGTNVFFWVAVADAFGENLVLHPSLLKFVEAMFDCKATDLPQDDHRLRLARVPASSRLIYGQDPETSLPSEYPVLTVHNVFVLPGLPPFFQLGFAFIKVRSSLALSKRDSRCFVSRSMFLESLRWYFIL